MLGSAVIQTLNCRCSDKRGVDSTNTRTLPFQTPQRCCCNTCYGACSSLSAMHSLTFETPPLHGSRYTEEDWNDDSTIENGQFYPLSKVETLFAL